MGMVGRRRRMIPFRSAAAAALLAAAFLLALSGCGGGGGKVEPPPDIESRARTLVETLASGDYAAAAQSFNRQVLEDNPEEMLRQAWTSLVYSAGELQEIWKTEVAEQGELRAVYVSCRFAAGDIVIKVVYDQEGLVAGFWFLAPDQVQQEQQATTYTPPPYADPSSFSEREVTVGNGDWELPGTLTVPNGPGPFPAVVLVHGSGPNNRDEGGGACAPFKDLAWGLATRGIAVLRYDKRTLVYRDRIAESEGMITVEEEAVDDAVAAAELLLSTPEADPSRLFVLGHSLGGMLIPRIAQACPWARGFIVMAGPARPFEDLIYEQTEYILGLDGEMDPRDQANLAGLRQAVSRVKDPALSPETPGNLLPLGGSGKWWISVRDIQPAQEARAITRPLLILQGERDYQVTMEDFSIWRQVLADAPNVTFISYPDLNHLFFTGTGKSTPQEYGQPGHVSGQVVEDIARFILE